MKTITMKLDYCINVLLRQLPLFYKTIKKGTDKKIRIIGMIRERNESLILKDSLDHISQFVDGIVVYDDASTDDSAEIALNHPAVLEVIINKNWRKNNRIWEETSNRRFLHNRAKKYNPKWFFYFDADERFEGKIKEFLLEECPASVDAIKIQLLDAYITKDDKEPFRKGQQLYNFRKYFGPERRDILMIWRNGIGADFIKKDAREPQQINQESKIVKFYCQHYGKSLSIEHWEETCKYYAENFPKYSDKWKARMGKAVHTRSDFDGDLYTWSEAKKNAIDMPT